MDGGENGEVTVGSLVKWLTHGRKLHICVHALPPMLQLGRPLCLEHENETHCCVFCDTAKMSPKGFAFCIRNKEISNRKAVASDDTFVGKCHMGITEIVKPVFYRGTPYCILYIGNILLAEDKEAGLARIYRMAQNLLIDKGALVRALETVQVLSRAELEQHRELAELLASEIQRFIHDSLLRVQDKKNERSGSRWYAAQALGYINRYYYADIRLSQIAKLYFINEQYLCRLFSKEFGVPFTGYLNRVRIEKAQELLCGTDKKVIEIAMMTGFNNVTYFNGVFKKRTGQTPVEYRKSRR